jgi:hypothetical protein
MLKKRDRLNFDSLVEAVRNSRPCHAMLAWLRWVRRTTLRSGETTARKPSSTTVIAASTWLYWPAQCQRYGLGILGYCLMPNHVHLIAAPERSDSLARALGRAHNFYSRWFNAVRRRSGHLWQNRFCSAPLGRDHLLTALRYVDLNPRGRV